MQDGPVRMKCRQETVLFAGQMSNATCFSTWRLINKSQLPAAFDFFNTSDFTGNASTFDM
jgi:hypothetical protein